MHSQVKSVSDEEGCSLEDIANRVAFLKILKAMKDLGWVWWNSNTKLCTS